MTSMTKQSLRHWQKSSKKSIIKIIKQLIAMSTIIKRKIIILIIENLKMPEFLMLMTSNNVEEIPFTFK